MSCQKNVEHITAVNSSLRKYLFARGYLLSDVVYDLNTYPFYCIHFQFFVLIPLIFYNLLNQLFLLLHMSNLLFYYL